MSSKQIALRSQEEVAEEIRGLSVANWVRLRKVATIYARNKSIEPEDLLQVAFLRFIAGSRTCPAHVDIVHSICEAMRSIADGELRKAQKRPKLVPVAGHGDPAGGVDPPDPRPDVDDRIVARELLESVNLGIRKDFADDLTAIDIFDGMTLGLEGEELRALTDLDLTSYQSKRRLIRRWIEKNFSKGWRS